MTIEPDIRAAGTRRPRVWLRSASNGDSLDWARIARTLWRGKWLLLGIVAGVLTATTMVVNRLPDMFEAEGFIMLDAQRIRLLPDATDTGASPSEGLQAELLEIRSWRLAERIVGALKLDAWPEFNPDLSGASTRLGTVEIGVSPVALEPRSRAVIENVLRRIDASPVAGSSVIRVSFTATDPVLAAEAVNALLEAYQDEQLRTQGTDLEDLKGFLETEIGRLRTQIGAAKLAVHGFRRDYDLLAQQAVDEQELTELVAQLTLLRNERIEAEARLGRAAGPGPGVAAVSRELNELEARRLDLERQIAEAATELGGRHPQLAGLQAELDSLERQRAAALQQQKQSLQDTVDVRYAQETALREVLERVQRGLEQRMPAEAELQSMEQEVAATGALLGTYLSRAAELDSQLRQQAPVGRIVSSAAAPLAPVAPRRGLIFGIALVTAVVGGALALFVRDNLDDTFRSAEQVEDLLGLPALGLVPLLGRPGRRGSDLERVVLERPASPFSEAMRSLRTAISVTDVGLPARTLLLTSALPGEGKSWTAMGLALTSARARWRTLIIDCDLHRPRLHELVRVTNGPGLSELLLGQATLSQALLCSDRSGLHLLTSGAPVADAAALLSSERMDQLLASAAEAYDLVILDAPPVLSVSDARVLSQRADKTVFLVSWGATRRADVLVGVNQLLEAGAQVGGLVLSQVNVRKHARYGYRDSGHYHASRYTSYLSAA